jgi:hypothetical protein
MSVEPNLCPLCGGANECAVAADQRDVHGCWCWAASFAAATLEQLPEAARGSACVCRRCAEAGANRRLERAAGEGPA